MVDPVKTTMTNENDDWEVAVDTGEFDKRIEQQEKDRAATQESISSTVNDDDNQNSSNSNLMKSNKPIRILKRPTSQSQLPVSNDINNSSQTLNSPFSNEITSSTTVPSISIIPRNNIKDSINSSQIPNSSNSSKPTVKSYEQRELEYKLARLRIMGEEESSAKDDDDDDNNNNNNLSTIETTSLTSDDTSKNTFNKSINSSQSLLQSHSTPGSYASNLYALNNTSSNTGAIHFTPNTNTTGPFSQQQYRGVYSSPYPPMPLAPPPPLLPPVHYPTGTVYMSPSSNPWYPYQQQQTPYGTPQYGHPQ